MLYHVSEIIVIVLALPVLMQIILPLGMLAGWSAWKGFKHLTGKNVPVTEGDLLTAR